MHIWEFRFDQCADLGLRCYRCDGALTQFATIVAGTYVDYEELGSRGSNLVEQTLRYHLPCAVDANLEEAQRIVKNTRVGEDPAVDALRPLVQSRAAGVRALAQKRSSALTARNAKVLEALEPARDPQGRPRVTVVIVGSLTSESVGGDWSEFMELARDGAVASPLREYVFETFSGELVDGVATDPSRPLIAAVFAARTGVKLSGPQRKKLTHLRALGTPTPALWIVGERATRASVSDPIAVTLRDALDRVGFRGDEAPILCSESVDPESMQALVAMLDAHIDGAHAAHATSTPVARLVLALDAAIREERFDELDTLLTSLLALDDQELSKDREGHARTLAVTLAKSAQVSLDSLRLLERVGSASDADAVLVAARHTARASKRGFGPAFLLADALLSRWSPLTRHALLASLFSEEPVRSTSQRDFLERQLVQSGDVAAAAILRAASANLKRASARKASLDRLAEVIESNATRAALAPDR
ncbi:MAG: hypothetical protein Q8Q09_25300 [Deltaproteobacteria bacterium]|nr:hypothetical protein [Deltaproteobacteria bacterium]